jgi:hypothetical protein
LAFVQLPVDDAPNLQTHRHYNTGDHDNRWTLKKRALKRYAFTAVVSRTDAAQTFCRADSPSAGAPFMRNSMHRCDSDLGSL